MPVTVAKLASDLPHGLAGSLEGVAHELGLLQAQILRMQDVCHTPDIGSALDAIIIRELQGLDLVSQRLGVLSMFVRDVVEATPFDPAIDLTEALEGMPLKDVAERLSAQARGEEPPDQTGILSGDFDLF